jgi:hypothetical protein
MRRNHAGGGAARRRDWIVIVRRERGPSQRHGRIRRHLIS